MNFNKYSVYSVVSVSEGQNEENIKKILDISLNFKQFKSVKEAKDFVKSRFNITNPVSNFPIGNNAYLSIKENEKIYSVNLVFSNENKTYTYKK